MSGDLPSLRDVIAQHGLGARKSLGQHFLLDLNLTRRIAREAGDLEGVCVVEVGPGPGGLTRALLDTNARAVLAIEKDPRCLEALQVLAERSNRRLRLIEGDALEIDPVDLTPAPRAIVANLPYNVGTALLVAWLRRAGEYERLVLMFQKEVAERIVAQPRRAAYGRLSVLCQSCCDCRILFTLPARAFTPPPRVDSAVICLTPKKTPLPVPLDALERETALAFGQRRKMLRSIFKTSLSEADFANLGLSPKARAEELTIAQHTALAKKLMEIPHGE